MNVYDCCKDCKKRHPKCHANCPDKAKADALNEKIKAQKRKHNHVIEYAREEKEKRLKRWDLKK